MYLFAKLLIEWKVIFENFTEKVLTNKRKYGIIFNGLDEFRLGFSDIVIFHPFGFICLKGFFH